LKATRQRIARLVRLVAANPQTLKYLGLQALWSVRPRTVESFPLSWPLDGKELSRTTIRWPESVPLLDAAGWEPMFRVALGTHVQVEPATIPHPFTSILMFDVVSRGHTSRVAIDYRDSNEVPDQCAESADLYFKLQFSRDGYAFEHVLPGGYVVRRQKFYRYLPWLRALRQRDPALDVYGRFGPRGELLRREVIGHLSRQGRFSFTGGMGTVLYSQSLAEAARAKVSIDLPGFGWFCHRLLEYFAVGSCVVAVRHRNRLHVELENGKHIAYIRDDGADVVDVCNYYLEHPHEREELMNNAQEYFDRYLHYRQLGAYYLHSIVTRLL
jgi:Glycosyl transferases group 1